jgi:polyhydroxyalkanoate synthase
MQDPAKMIELQAGYWGKTLKHFVEAQAALVKHPLQAPEDPGPKDKRFANPLWDTHPWFNFWKRQYQINAEAMHAAVSQLEGLSPREKKKLDYFARQIVDMLAPTNLPWPQPRRAGARHRDGRQSPVDGLVNLVHDLERGEGELGRAALGRHGLRVGENLATTPGEVVFRNRISSCIQYRPTTAPGARDSAPDLSAPGSTSSTSSTSRSRTASSSGSWDQGFTLVVVSLGEPRPSYNEDLAVRLCRGGLPDPRSAR